MSIPFILPQDLRSTYRIRANRTPLLIRTPEPGTSGVEKEAPPGELEFLSRSN